MDKSEQVGKLLEVDLLGRFISLSPGKKENREEKVKPQIRIATLTAHMFSPSPIRPHRPVDTNIGDGDFVEEESLLTDAEIISASSEDNQGRPPVYNTVGSVYNPVTTPLQPPTRRGRTARYQFYQSPTGDISSPFPPNIIASVQDVSSGSPGGVGRRVQYSPLQQNFDRAMSPSPDTQQPRRLRIEMPSPGLRSGNTPASSLPGGDRASTASASSQEAENLRLADSLTARFNVKGLTNLASYPNPMQYPARLALAKARTTQSNATRNEIPPPFTPVASHSTRGLQYSTVAGGTALASGPGAPQPLAAGPPGQRQYRPSALDGTIRVMGEATAFNNNNEGSMPRGQHQYPVTPNQQHNLEEDDQSDYMGYQTTNMRPDMPTMRPAHMRSGVSTATSTFGDDCRFTTSRHRMMRVIPEAGAEFAEPTSDEVLAARAKVMDTEHFSAIQKYYPHGPPSNYQGKQLHLVEDWQAQYPLSPHASQFTGILRIDKTDITDKEFYRGTRGLARGMYAQWKTQDRSVGSYQSSHHSCDSTPNDVGQVLGVDDRGRVHYQSMSVEQANAADACVHAEPLLEMLLQKLEVCTEDSKKQNKAK